MPRSRAGADGDPIAAGSPLVRIQSGSGSSPPLFCVHAEAGDVSLYYNLVGHLAREQTILGLCAPALAELGSDRRLEAMAARHVREIKGAQPSGPYLILGECTGGALAYEIARQLRAAGEDVALLALIDAFAPGLPRLSRLMPKPVYRILHRARILGFHCGNLVRLGMADKLAYAAAKAARAHTALTSKVSGRLHRTDAAVSPRVAFREALAAYDPEPYAGSMVLFRAARLPLGIEAAPDMGWGGLVQDIEVETVPGYFTTPISEPGVRILADGISRHIGECTREA
jgi:thioesterase domain-containing protein